MLKPLLYLRAMILPWFLDLHTLMCSFVVLLFLLLRMPRKVLDWIIARMWCYFMLLVSGIKVEMTGGENVPQDKGFLFLFTHSSHFDIPVMFAYSPKGFRFGAKAELLKIPFFGQAARLAGTLPITRHDRAKVFEVYKEAETRVANGEAFALAPEGTRRKTEEKEIKPFKSGPFIFAFNAKMPIVPVVMCGVDQVMQKGSILVNKDQWVKKVGLRFLP
ncbi:MAG: 1-acyl-sn-glycerol-3-phosphate acyltransferase, partial [Bdellovibrionales bacterium]|nr:1-acyl-sn-glycerol-3-phosphate acyltransferase [Bdellovibrionales bacterium]NQZ20417.1 1-acyl-sn-glycerol-3-phosphate acyltransferase [Bdellovibrionales bacterium]